MAMAIVSETAVTPSVCAIIITLIQTPTALKVYVKTGAKMEVGNYLLCPSVGV